MNGQHMPSRQLMIKAFLRRDASYQGVFFAGVRQHGSVLSYRMSRKNAAPEQLEFFATARRCPVRRFSPLQAMSSD
jgi:methylphosphotriester-DNA--protein-cysteine methyltransferase